VTTLASLTVRIVGDASKLKSTLTATDNEIKGFGASVKSSLTSMAGLLVMGALTAGVTAFGAASVGAAIDFDEAMTNTNSILKLSQAEIDALSEKVLSFGAGTRAGPQAVAEAFYDIVGGVADATTHMAILEAATATAEAGNTSLGGTTSALIGIMNSYGFAADKAAVVSDVLTATVGMGVGTMEEFAAAFPLVTGLAASAGVELENVGTSLAFLTTKGFSASQSATKLTAIMTAFLKPNEQMKAAIKAMGLESGSAGLELYGLAGMTGRLEQAMGGSVDAMSAALGTTEALTGALALAGPGFDEFNESFLGTIDGATAAAQAIQNMSTAARFDLLGSKLDEAKIKFGEMALPVLELGVNVVLTALTAAEDIATQAKIMGDNIGRIIGERISESVPESMRKIGDLSLPILASTFSGIGETITSTLNTEIAGVKPFDLLLKSAVEIAAPGGGEILTMLNQFVTGINAHGLSPTQSLIFKAMVDAQPVWYDTLTEDIRSSLVSKMSSASGLAPVPWDTPIVATPSGVDWINDFNVLVRDSISEASKAEAGWAVDLTVDPTPEMNSREDFVGRADLMLKSGLSGVNFDVTAALSVTPTLANAASLQSSMTGLVQGAINLMSINVTPNVTVATPGGAGGGAGGNPFGPELPQHAAGLANVPYDGYIAQLHKGERVVPASQNRGMSGGRGEVHIHMDGQYYGSPSQEWAESMKRVLLESGY